MREKEIERERENEREQERDKRKGTEQTIVRERKSHVSSYVI